MNKHEIVIGSESVKPGLMRPYLEKTGLQNIKFSKSSTEGLPHRSAYAVGKYEGVTAGIRFGGKVKHYEYEAECLKRFSHQGLPKCYTVGEMETPIGTFGYMIVNHFSAAPLKDNLDFSSEQERKNLKGNLLELVSLMDYIHSKNVVHQDIASDHVLVDKKGKVYLIDFHIWDDAEAISATSDFCGWSKIPNLIYNELCMSPRLIESSKVEWRPRGFGRMLKEILPSSKTQIPFVNGLDNIANYLIGKSEKFIKHPKSRDFISNRLKSMLNEL